MSVSLAVDERSVEFGGVEWRVKVWRSRGAEVVEEDVAKGQALRVDGKHSQSCNCPKQNENEALQQYVLTMLTSTTFDAC